MGLEGGLVIGLGQACPRWAWPGQGDPCRKEERSWERAGVGRSPRE